MSFRLLTALLASALLLPSLAFAKFPARLHDGGRYPDDLTYVGGSDWEYLSRVPVGVDASQLSAYEAGIGSGLHADNAWRFYTSGDPAVIVAVFDSGILWDQKDLVNKHFLNRGELPPPATDAVVAWPGVDSAGETLDCLNRSVWSQSGGEYDVNHDGVFNIKDYRCDSRVNSADGVDAADFYLDPSDLIHATAPAFVMLNGQDDDGNGYVDDISGWDFMWDDNDPYDDTRYSHGTGEARGAAAEADNGAGSPGMCPDCMVLNVRVSDSFVADSNNLAQGIVFAVDTHVRVVSSALGTLSGSVFAQAAVDFAYANNIVVVTSAADETSMHHFPISSGEHTVMVHAVVPDVDPDEWAQTPPGTFLRFSNCTNYGAHLFMSVPSGSCSSGAVERTSGVAGLLYSYAMQHDLMPLTANEVQQLFRAGIDDINDPRAAHDKKLFPSQAGWDQYFGYGRTNAESALRLMKDGKIPPEANLDSPRWFTVLDPSRTPKVAVTGFARAARTPGKFKYELTYAPGITPAEADFTQVIAKGEAGDTVTDFGEWDLSLVDTAADADYGAITSENSRAKIDQFTVTLRLRVTDAQGLVGEYRKAVYLRKDPDLLPGFPIDVGSSGESSPKLADMDGDGKWDIITALSDGTVRVYNYKGELLPGFPALTRKRDAFAGNDPKKIIAASASYRSGKMMPVRSGITATPAVGKLDGVHTAIVVATLDGDVVAFGSDGAALPGFPQHMDALDSADTNAVQILDDGYFASPVLADLDGNGTLEIISAGMDGQIYVYDYQGNRVAPFPIEARDHSMSTPADLVENPDDATCALLLSQLKAGTYAGGGYRSRIIGSPAVGDIDGDGKLEIVVGTSEIYPGFCDSDHTGTLEGTSRLYAFRADGSQPAGFPMKIPNQTNLLPYVGRGIPNAPVLIDINDDGADDIAVHQIAQLGGLGIMDWKGKNLLTFDQGANGAASNVGSGGVFRAKPYPVLINFGSFGDLDVDGKPDFFLGAVTADMLVSTSNDSERRDADHLLLGFSGRTGKPLTGFPQVMEDIQFFMNPSIADLDGDGLPEVLNGSGGFILHAWNYKGESPRGWSKFTGQWLLASPAIGDVNGDGLLDVVTNTRDGFLWAWKTRGAAERRGKNSVQWASFRHDNYNSGNYGFKLPMQPGPGERQPAAGCGCDVGAATQRRSEPREMLTLLALLLLTRVVLRVPKKPSKN